MKDVLMTILPLIVAGLGRLSFTHPVFAIKLLSCSLALLLSIQMCLRVYGSACADNQILVERDISNAFLPLDSLTNGDPGKKLIDRGVRYNKLIKENEKIKALINQVLIGSSDKMKRLNENLNNLFYIAYAIIISLAIFSYIFFKYKSGSNSGNDVWEHKSPMRTREKC